MDKYLASIDKYLASIVEFVLNPDKSRIFLFLKIPFIITLTVFLILIIIFLFRTSWFNHRFLGNLVEFIIYRPFKTKGASKKWAKIIKKIESGEESEYKLAVIEADDLLKDTLDQADYKGENLEEQLKKLEPIITLSTDEVKKAHKVRNKIVYDPNYKLTLEEAKKTVEAYEKILQSLDLF